jgi:HD superfamily phosphohydrolase
MIQGNQNKLDKNQNGKIDPQDFKVLRGEKEERDMDRPTVKDRLKRYNSTPKKPPVKQVGEMGKPSLKAKFEAAMQKQYKSRPENMKEDIRSVLTELPSKEVRVLSKKKPLKSMSKKSSIFEKITDAVPPLYGFKLKNKNN